MFMLKPYRIHNSIIFSIFLLFFGCGFTPINSNNIEVINRNSVSLVSEVFRLTKIEDASDFGRLPREFQNYKNQIKKFDFYFAQSPTQNSGGFTFIAEIGLEKLIICLKKPDPQSGTTSSLTNPIALIKVKKGLNVETRINFCKT